jgi:hypothetical protein
MPTYYDLDDMDLSNSRLRAQYVPRYGIKIVLAAYRAVTETARGNNVEIQRRLAATVAELIETDEEIAAAIPQFKEELKNHPSMLSTTPKERENMWKRALGYKKDIKNWNSRAPPAKDVPSGETDPTAWRHMTIRQKLYVERFPDKAVEDMPSHFQPSIVWPAYVALELINDHKFNIMERDDDDAPSKAATKSRVQQRDDSRPQKIHKNNHSNNVPHNTFARSVLVQNRQQRNAENLLLQKARELQTGASTTLFQSSLALLVAAKDGALDKLTPDQQTELLVRAGAATQTALQCLEDMVRNPWSYEFSKHEDDIDSEVQIIDPPVDEVAVPSPPIPTTVEALSDKNLMDESDDEDQNSGNCT